MFGSNCLPVHSFEVSVDVSGRNASAGSEECTTISKDIEYDHSISEHVYMLVYHRVIHCEILSNHLMCPMQSRMAGVNINELPKFSTEDSDEKTHAKIVREPLNHNQPLITPLVLKGDDK